jgi:hypothetical protein
MQNITSVSGLKDVILLLENKQAIQGRLLKEQFNFICESLKPVNLIKSTLNEVVGSSSIIGSIFNTSLGLTAGYLSKKIITSASGNPLIKLFGIVLQYGITYVIAKHHEVIKFTGLNFLRNIFIKNELNS